MRKIFLLLIIILTFISSAFAADDQSSSDNPPQSSDYNYQNELNKMVAESNAGVKNVQDMIKQLVSSNSIDMPGGQAKDFYQKGLELTEAGKFEEARLFFDRAVQLSESEATTDKINRTQERIKIQDKALGQLREVQLREQQDKQKEFEQTTENIYQNAISLYRQKNYLLARESFNNVDKLISNYKSTQTYLDDINKTLAKQDAEQLERQKAQEELQQKQAEEARVKEEQAKQVVLEQQHKQELEIQRKQELEQKLQEQKNKQETEKQAKEAEIAKQKQEEDQKRQELEKQKQEKLEALRKENEEKEQLRKATDIDYNSAIDLYRAQRYQEAIDKFQEVNKKIPSYRSTDRYKKKSEQLLARQQKRQQEEAARKQTQEQRIQEQQKQKALEEQRREEQETAKKQIEEQKVQEQKKIVEQLQKEAEQNRLKAEELRKQNEVETVRIKEEQKKRQDLETQRKEEELSKNKSREQRIQEEKNLIEQRRQEAEQMKQKAAAERKQREAEAVRIKEEKERLKVLEQQSKQDAQDAKKMLEEQNRQKTEAGRKIQEVKEKEAKEELARHQEILIKEKLAKDQARKQVESIYSSGIDFYRDRKYLEAKDKFLTVRSQSPGYKASERYLRKIDSIMAEQQKREERQKQQAIDRQQRQEQEASRKEFEHKKWLETHQPKQVASTQQQVIQPDVSETAQAPAVPVVPAAAVAPVAVSSQSKVEQEQEAQLLDDLAQRSSELYRQISDMADDRSTAIAKDKLGKVDAVLNNLKNQKEKALMQKRQQEQRESERLHHQQLEETYDEAINLLRSKKFDEAKKKFLEVESIEPNYRGARNYLIKINEDQRKAQEEAVAEKAKNEEKAAEEKRLEEERRVREQEAQKKAQEEQEHQAKVVQYKQQLAETAQKAASINDEILHMTVAKDYVGAKAKFAELENVMANLKATKEAIAEEENVTRFKFQSENSKNTNNRIDKVFREKHLEKAKNENDQEIIKRERYKDFEEKKIQAFKEQEIKRQHEVMFKQASSLYDSAKYGEARIILSELASEGDRRAPAFIKKIDHILEQSVVKASKEEGKKRNDYINEQRYKQKMKDEEQAQEQAQRRLFKQQLEHQKEMAEQERQSERRHLEALKMQEKERQEIEDKHKLSEEQSKDKEEAYHFRKVPPALLTFSDKSKDKMLPDADKWKFAQVNKKADKTPIKIQASQPVLPNKVQEVLPVKVQEKQKPSIEVNKELIARQKRLEEDRKATKAAFENGVDSMYKEAVRLYKSGDYKASSKRFTDIQDLIPNYKDSKDYLDKASNQVQKVILPTPAVVPAVVVVPAPSVVQAPQPVGEQTPQQKPVEQEAPQGLFGLFHRKVQAHKDQEVKVVQTPSKVDAFSRENAIAKTLDLFDSNPK